MVGINEVTNIGPETDAAMLGRVEKFLENVLGHLDGNRFSAQDIDRIDKIVMKKYDGNHLLPIAMGHIRLLRVAVEEHRRTVTAAIKPMIIILQGRN